MATKHIEVTPGIAGGKPRIAGHRITVQDIVIWHEVIGPHVNQIVQRFAERLNRHFGS